MSTTQSDVSTGLTPDSTTLADRLREVAAWLEAHPEIRGTSGYVYVNAHKREDLAALAAALGDRARESATSYDVRISGKFGGDKYGTGSVSVAGVVSLQTLGSVTPPPKPLYDPILKPSTDEADDDWSVRR